jgi:hypothetical protein
VKLAEIDMQCSFRVLVGTDRSQVAAMVLSPDSPPAARTTGTHRATSGCS